MQKEKDSSSFDIGMLIAFHNVVVHVLALTSSVLFGNGDVGLFVLQSRDILEDVIRAFVDQYDIRGSWSTTTESVLQNVSVVIGSVLIPDSTTGNLNEHSD